MLYEPRASDISRRFFLQAGAAAGGGLLIGWVPTAEATDGGELFAPNAFIRLDRLGKLTVVSPMIEMGQGTYTSLPMLVAEELDIDMSDVSVDHSPPNDKLYGNSHLGGVQTTGNSSSVRAFYLPMRHAGSAARSMLISAAAAKLNIDASALTTEPGHVLNPATKQRIAYGELVDAAAKLPVPTNIKLKDPRTFRIIGTPAKRLDVSGKVNGTAMYGIDVKIPGMKIATIAASPVFGGTVASLDEAAALKVPGVHQVAKLDNAVAVIADHYWAAKQGLEAAAVTFNGGPHASVSTADVVVALEKASQNSGAVAKAEGDVGAALAKSATKLDAIYEAPFLAHATMEPINCTVHVTPDGCDIWVGTQIPTVAQQAVAQTLGLKPEQVRLHNHLLGGGFGRRLEYDFIVQAALVAKQAKDPVKVVWSREEDIQHDMYRPYYYDRFSAGLDEHGLPISWSHRIAGSAIMARFFPPLFKDGIDPDGVDGAVDMPYDIPNKRVEFVREEPPGIPTAFWRGVGPTHNVYVVESFIDELAAAAKRDPVDYRRALLGKNPRALYALNRAAEMAGWGTPLGDRRGRGVSVNNAFGSYMAQIAEVTVAKSGDVHVDRVVCVVDTGVAINPDTIIAQMQSGIIYGLTATLWGEITLKDGRVQQSNFDDYRIMRINEAPIIEVEVVKSEADPGGIGEPGTSGLAPAVLNAVYAATGVRLRKLPIKAELLKSV
ncbi:xanthine dehydrogenase family protein molybdopterin-binding subunit [Hyphomicrobium sp.]|uniref:xanthine dehydrogenase family protein molybdopterin-binding subunit n=1 Tax=Hyphomicrobium sp. TaxID=82 RepID=UPI002E2F1285|nr:xanthine dehydrogenase family protein molybdopterin-binding subunit [Hyphomicrobium sp.]HEX2841169.1 xanthine dehydrogenase family protein molybdopterin-binding subunit [Hyphomicrobium sp.]